MSMFTNSDVEAWGNAAFNLKPGVIQKYIDNVSKGIAAHGFEMSHTWSGENNQLNLKFLKDGKGIGSSTRTFAPGGAELSTLWTKGNTGLLSPLYKAENKFFEEVGMRVKINALNPKTFKKFGDVYSGSHVMSSSLTEEGEKIGVRVWSPSAPSSFPEFGQVSKTLPVMDIPTVNRMPVGSQLRGTGMTAAAVSAPRKASSSLVKSLSKFIK